MNHMMHTHPSSRPRAAIAVTLVGLLLVALGTPPPAAADPPRRQTVPVAWHPQAVTLEDHISAGPVHGASASLVATASGATLRFQTRELVPGNAYTLWLVFVNNPEECDSQPCNDPEVLTNPSIDAQVGYGAGTIAGGSGQATFAARLNAGPADGWFEDRSLNDPLTAEFHLVVNDHGPKVAAHMPGMIRTYRGGCSDDSPFPPIFPDSALADGEPGPNRCLLYQAAIFEP
jgi:hypothetical protein